LDIEIEFIGREEAKRRWEEIFRLVEAEEWATESFHVRVKRRLNWISV